MDKSNHEYHNYISTMMRAPSIMYGVPQYPTVHKAFKHEPADYEQHQEQCRTVFELCKWKNTEGLDQISSVMMMMVFMNLIKR
ncbi:hypothetical protein LINGRAHAP2_LOCUS16930 [Linum grandiflorum]